MSELRELARGIHPAVLEHGLSAALDSLAVRSTVPTTVSFETSERLPERFEFAAYFVASEALANIAKHAHAENVTMRVWRSGPMASIEIADDGVGGADDSGGSGLRGLADRVESLDGHLHGAQRSRQPEPSSRRRCRAGRDRRRQPAHARGHRGAPPALGHRGGRRAPPPPSELLRDVELHEPDVAIVDIRMPPTHTDEGVRAAHEIRTRYPRIAIVILSQHVDLGTAMRVLTENPERLGYLLKDRVTDVDEFVRTLRRVTAGGSALDPEVVSRLLAHTREQRPMTPRDREVLQLVAEGRSNRAIAERLGVTERAVQKHVTSIFLKLDLPDSADDNRRILAVLAYLKPELARTSAGR